MTREKNSVCLLANMSPTAREVVGTPCNVGENISQFNLLFTIFKHTISEEFFA